MKFRKLIVTFLLLPFLVACGSGGRSSPDASGQSSPVRQETLQIQTPNGQVWGEVFRPDDNDRHPVMIYSHGLGSSYHYGEPYIKHLEADIWELRPIRDRILFVAWKGNSFVLLHHFVKKTQKTPRREIEKAKRELDDLRKRGILDES